MGSEREGLVSIEKLREAKGQGRKEGMERNGKGLDYICLIKI